jgi:hypothetical protein
VPLIADTSGSTLGDAEPDVSITGVRDSNSGPMGSFQN